MDIIQAPNAILSTPTKSVKNFDARLERLISDMKRTLESQEDPEGVGLAANQVGIPLSLFVARESRDAEILVCINPKIIKSTSQKALNTKSLKKLKKKPKTKLEGCLSLKYIWGNVARNDKVLLEYQESTGKICRQWFRGFTAIIIQHEVDHLCGVLFTQRVLEQSNKLYKEEDGELEPYEI